jgi:hypothetical protein
MTPTLWYASRSIWLTLNTCTLHQPAPLKIAHVTYLFLLVVAVITQPCILVFGIL